MAVDILSTAYDKEHFTKIKKTTSNLGEIKATWKRLLNLSEKKANSYNPTFVQNKFGIRTISSLSPSLKLVLKITGWILKCETYMNV